MDEIDTRIEQLVHLANRAVQKAYSMDNDADREWWMKRSAECEAEITRLCQEYRRERPQD